MPWAWFKTFFKMIFLRQDFWGRRVIAGGSGGLPEAVIDQQTGLLVEPDNPGQLAAAINQLLADPVLGQRLGLQGMQRVLNQFDWPSRVEKIKPFLDWFMPAISVIIPAYNAEKTLKNCLQSLEQQTFKDFEIIVVNDGSTDQTPKILTASDPKIKVINQKNAGAAAARNRGAKEAQGELIIFCDADLILKPKMLEIMFLALKENPSAAYAYSSFKFGLKTFWLWPFDPDKLKQMPYIHTTALLRRHLFPGFDKNLKRFQDWDLWLTLLEQGKTGVFVPEVLFTVRPGGTMSSWLPKFVYKLPWKTKKAKKYLEAKKIIQEKHRI